MNKVLFFVISFLFLSSCGSDKGVISESKMADVLRDIHMTDGVLNTYRYNLNRYVNVDSVYLYKSVFQKNKITRDEFIKSLQFYAKYPKRMDRIYTMVVDDLSTYQQEKKEEYEKSAKKGSVKKDSKAEIEPGNPR